MSNNFHQSPESREDNLFSGSLSVSCKNFQLPFGEPDGLTLISPSQTRQRMAQTHYLFDLKAGVGKRFEVNLETTLDTIPALESSEELPLGLSSTIQWQSFCIGPHSDLPISPNRLHISQRAFNRFTEIDVKQGVAQLLDPKVNDDFLSATNWLDPGTGDFWFASWRFQDSIRRVREPGAPVEVSIWKAKPTAVDPERIWCGELGDFLHQLNISATRRYLILCEMGMRTAMPVPTGHPGNNPSEWRTFQEQGIRPSQVLVVDLESGREWRLLPLTPTAAHVEFDPDDPDLCYLSCHNTALVRGANTLFGTGVISCYRLSPQGPQSVAQFTCPGFYRITSHQVFRHRGRVLIGVTGFQDKIFLIDARTMQLYRTITLFDGLQINTETQPHFCQQEARAPYGLAHSPDGETLYVTGSGILFVVETATGVLRHEPFSFYQDPSDETVAGHLTSSTYQLS